MRSGDGHGGSGAAHRTKQKICVKSQIFYNNNVPLGPFATLSPRFKIFRVQHIGIPVNPRIEASKFMLPSKYYLYFKASSQHVVIFLFDTILQKNLLKLVN